MITKALLVKVEAKSGKEKEVEQFLQSALPLVAQEPDTISWFAVKFNRTEYGIFDAFSDEKGRQKHLEGEVAKALMSKTEDLFTKAPNIEKIDIIAHKVPNGINPSPTTKGVLLTFKAKEGHKEDVEKLLTDARVYAFDEPETTSWFAINFSGDEFGIFDVFPDNGARLKHLAGQIPVELLKHSLTILGSVPDISLLDVLAEKNPELKS